MGVLAYIFYAAKNNHFAIGLATLFHAECLQLWISKACHSLEASSTTGLFTQKVGMWVDAREGLKEALIAIGLSKPFLGTGIQ